MWKIRTFLLLHLVYIICYQVPFRWQETIKPPGARIKYFFHNLNSITQERTIVKRCFTSLLEPFSGDFITILIVKFQENEKFMIIICTCGDWFSFCSAFPFCFYVTKYLGTTGSQHDELEYCKNPMWELRCSELIK